MLGFAYQDRDRQQLRLIIFPDIHNFSLCFSYVLTLTSNPLPAWRHAATMVPYNEKRDSVKLLSSNWYKPGTVFVLDAAQ